MNQLFKVFILTNMLLWLSFNIEAQTDQSQIQKRLTLGLNSGISNQAILFLENSDYQYKNQFYRVEFRFPITNKKNWNFEMVAAPSYYITEYRLQNKHYIKPEDNENYVAEREKYTQERILKEYALQISLLWRYNISKKLSAYSLIGSGPMLIDKESERQAKGFNFSNYGGFGVMYQVSNIFLDLRGSIRHASNLQLREPNNGYDMMSVEIGVSMFL
ncbi:MAG: hypothetical protein HKN40_12115 [Winogradskyella sp.]|uniref:acyloxyacyl hydrolase n=1 Tax=Winogradskyella sp. TaxID=1883156 RepID=UPI00183C90C2|nr:hypothetical protein [Winogradskyella sp.]